MTIKVITDIVAAADPSGATTRLYKAGEEIGPANWQRKIGEMLVSIGAAEEAKVVEPTEVKRARNDDGTLKADDPATPNVNEAWEGGEAPEAPVKKKRGRPRKS